MMFSRREQTQKCDNARGKQPSNHNRSRGKTSRAPPLPITAGPPVHPFSFRIGIVDRQPDLPPDSDFGKRDPDSTFVIAVLEGVVDQDHGQLPDPAFIGVHMDIGHDIQRECFFLFERI